MASLTPQRLFLFIDDLASRVNDILWFVSNLGEVAKRITLVCAERHNEWNIYCEPLWNLVSSNYDLEYLSVSEIRDLVSTLERHNSLGELQSLSRDERIESLKSHAGRQLLVALHEATFGRRFEDIIEDEYNNILPDEAKVLYLTICTLNRLAVPVRAGLISRIHDIPFEYFSAKLFLPLENVVYAKPDKLLHDHVYVARHPHIAQIVFERVLRDSEDRFDLFTRILKELNIDYSTDMRAFRLMIRGRTLVEVFPNYEHVRLIYEYAFNVAGEDPYLFHQRAIYEMNRPNGNLQNAQIDLQKALSLRPSDHTVRHSLGELSLRFAERATSNLQRVSYLKQAAKLAAASIKDDPSNSHGYHTLIKSQLGYVECLLSGGEADAQLLEMGVGRAERALRDALQQFPNNSIILADEAELAKLLHDDSRILKSLEKASEYNPRNSSVAIALAKHYSERGQPSFARKVLEASLGANPGDRSLHFAFAKLLVDSEPSNHETILYHLSRSYTDGDRNYLARILHGRELYVADKIQDCAEFFEATRQLQSPPAVRDNIQFPLPERFTGEVTKSSPFYSFVSRDIYRDTVFLHRWNAPDIWDRIRDGVRLSFRIGFTLRGVNAFDVELLS
jgi:hypothetical protein